MEALCYEQGSGKSFFPFIFAPKSLSVRKSKRICSETFFASCLFFIFLPSFRLAFKFDDER